MGRCICSCRSKPNSDASTPRDSPSHTTLSLDVMHSVLSIVAATFTAKIEKPILARLHNVDRALPFNTHANDDRLSPCTRNTQLRNPGLFETTEVWPCIRTCSGSWSLSLVRMEMEAPRIPAVFVVPGGPLPILAHPYPLVMRRTL